MTMKTTKYFWTLCLLFAAFSFVACSDDDNGNSDELRPSTSMTIDKVFLQDVKSNVPDREVTFARLGQLIRIQGSGFSGLRKVLINGYETYFNNALMTDKNIWVQLKKETPIADADDEVRNTITLIKKNGEMLVYDFIIMASSPSITSVDNTLPKHGETVTVYGDNLQETTLVTLPDGTTITEEDIISDEDGEYYSFEVPGSADLSVAGSITSVGANGTAKTPEYFNDNNCYILNFDGLGSMGSWSATYGTDDLVDDPLNTGRGKVCMLIPQSKLDDGGVDAGSNSLLWATAGNDEPTDDWTSRMYEFIPEETLASDVAIQFDIYVPGEWFESGQLEFSLQNNLSNYGYGSACTKFSSQYINTAAVWVPWLNEDGTTTPFTTGGRWQTITLPLSKFGNYNPDTATKDADKATAAETTFQKVCEDRNSGSYRNFLMLFVNADLEFSEDKIFASSTFSQPIYIDNIRVVNIKSIPVSDFDDEEEE